MWRGRERAAERAVGRAQVLPELVDTCRSHNVTDIVMVHEYRGEPDGLVVCHLPYGPTAYFGIFNTVSMHMVTPLKGKGEASMHNRRAGISCGNSSGCDHSPLRPAWDEE